MFCIELEEYRPSELGSIIFRPKGPDLRKKLGGTYRREIFRVWKKDVLVNNFGTTEHIELILVPIDQKLAELTDRIRNFSEKRARKFFEIVFSKSHKSGGVHPSRFINFSEKPLDPYQKLIAIELSNLGQF